MALKQALSIIIVAVMVSGIFFGCLCTGKAESIPTPSVPEFTLNYVAYPYDIPPVTAYDPISGKDQVVQLGSHVENKSVLITVTNLPYTYSSTEHNYHLYFDIRVKDHAKSDWVEVFPIIDRYASAYGDKFKALHRYTPLQSNSTTTVINYQLGMSSEYWGLSEQVILPSRGQIDFQIQAVVGYDTEAFEYYRYQNNGHFIEAAAFVERGDWSPTQTITIEKTTPTSTPTTPTYTSQPIPYGTTEANQSGNNWTLPQLDLNLIGFTLLGGVIVVLLVFLVLLRKRIRVLELKQNGT